MVFYCLKSTVEYQSNVWNLLKINNEDTRTTSFLHPVKTSENFWSSHVFNGYRNDVNLVSLLLILSRFYPLLWCFHCIFNWINFDYVLHYLCECLTPSFIIFFSFEKNQKLCGNMFFLHYLHYRTFINSLLSFYKEDKITEHLFE